MRIYQAPEYVLLKPPMSICGIVVISTVRVVQVVGLGLLMRLSTMRRREQSRWMRFYSQESVLSCINRAGDPHDVSESGIIGIEDFEEEIRKKAIMLGRGK